MIIDVIANQAINPKKVATDVASLAVVIDGHNMNINIAETQI
ncbi:MAG: hypothetical protein WC349_02180 [Patescibacteria group bacterium]|jgi:hypothetical protein